MRPGGRAPRYRSWPPWAHCLCRDGQNQPNAKGRLFQAGGAALRVASVPGSWHSPGVRQRAYKSRALSFSSRHRSRASQDSWTCAPRHSVGAFVFPGVALTARPFCGAALGSTGILLEADLIGQRRDNVKPSNWYLLSALWMLVAASFLDGLRALPPVVAALIACWISERLLHSEKREAENELHRQTAARLKLVERGPSPTSGRRGGA